MIAYLSLILLKLVQNRSNLKLLLTGRDGSPEEARNMNETFDKVY